MDLKRSPIKVTALALVVVLSSFASADTGGANSFGLKLGAFYPTSKAARDSLSKTGYDIGVSYFLPDQGSTQSSIDADYFRVGGSNYFQGLSVGYTARFFGSNAAPTAPFFGVSGGVSFNKLRTTTLGSGGSGGGSASQNKTQVYGEAIAGYRFNKQSSVELFYRFTGKMAGIDATAAGVRATFRF